MDRIAEHQEKIARLHALMDEKQLDGICLFKFMNYAWCSAGGSNRVVTGSERGCSVLVVLRDGRKYAAAPANETQRIMTEQVAGLGFESIVFPWYGSNVRAILERTAGAKLGSDVPIPGMECIEAEIDRLRFSLTEAEQDKARRLAALCSDETAALCATLRPGMTEFEIAARLDERLLAQGVRPAVLLIGVDERLGYCRHPALTATKLARYALVSLVGERDGLHVTLTRSVHFGRVPEELQKKFDAACRVDLSMCAATTAGAAVGDIFSGCKDAYAAAGYPDEWRMHHQGGAIGYNSREFRAGEREENVRKFQMFGWNPTVQGAKSEETILVNGEGQPETITTAPLWWPIHRTEGGSRPAILEV